MTDYTINLLRGRLLVNGMPAEDFLDTIDREYWLLTSAKITPEIKRLIQFAFEAGRDAELSEPLSPEAGAA